MPLKVALTPSSDVGSGSPGATASWEMKLLPNSETMEPGDAGPSPEKEAPFRIPLAKRVGGGVPVMTGVASPIPVTALFRA